MSRRGHSHVPFLIRSQIELELEVVFDNYLYYFVLMHHHLSRTPMRDGKDVPTFRGSY